MLYSRKTPYLAGLQQNRRCRTMDQTPKLTEAEQAKPTGTCLRSHLLLGNGLYAYTHVYMHIPIHVFWVGFVLKGRVYNVSASKHDSFCIVNPRMPPRRPGRTRSLGVAPAAPVRMVGGRGGGANRTEGCAHGFISAV